MCYEKYQAKIMKWPFQTIIILIEIDIRITTAVLPALPPLPPKKIIFREGKL